MERPEISWRAWVQANFTPLTLLGLVVLSLIATVSLMHEDAISDKYVTWLEGFCMGAMTSLALALRTAASTDPTHPVTPPADPSKEK